jgi:hypothetical protein
MKKIGFFLCLIFLAVSAFGQQVLWSTSGEFDARIVPINNVIAEVLNFYEQYSYYYDYTGYNKATFIKEFGEDWDFIYDIDTMSVYAFRAPMEGGGSGVLVMCLDRNNVNIVIFTNVWERGAINTFGSNRGRFQNWFRTLIN